MMQVTRINNIIVSIKCTVTKRRQIRTNPKKACKHKAVVINDIDTIRVSKYTARPQENNTQILETTMFRCSDKRMLNKKKKKQRKNASDTGTNADELEQKTKKIRSCIGTF